VKDDNENTAIDLMKAQNDSRINYSVMEQARTKMLQEQLKGELRRREAGRTMSLRRVCLRMVVDGNYKEASEIIDVYLQQRKVYPSLFARVEPHAVHAKELINAVRAKRNFPNLSSLSISKQQEILDNAVAHFDELRVTLKNVERMVKDEAVKDIRSSVYVVRTSVYALAAVMATALTVELTQGGLGMLMWTVFSQFADDTYVYLAKAVGFL
jgi:hypothetical protein